MFYDKVKAKYRIISDVVDINTAKPQAEAGFDLTDFETKENFMKILKLAGVKGEKAGTVIKDTEAKAFVWTGDGIKIYAGADPMRGIRFNGDDTGEEAYASYIGLSGTPEMVKKIFDAIKKVANYKDANPSEREFI